MHDRLHFGASGKPLESQNIAPKWPKSTQNDVQNGVCKISVDFGEKVSPPGGPGDPPGGLRGSQMHPQDSPLGAQNRPNEASRPSECTQNNTANIDVSFEDPKVVK